MEGPGPVRHKRQRHHPHYKPEDGNKLPERPRDNTSPYLRTLRGYNTRKEELVVVTYQIMGGRTADVSRTDSTRIERKEVVGKISHVTFTNTQKLNFRLISNSIHKMYRKGSTVLIHQGMYKVHQDGQVFGHRNNKFSNPYAVFVGTNEALYGEPLIEWQCDAQFGQLLSIGEKVTSTGQNHGHREDMDFFLDHGGNTLMDKEDQLAKELTAKPWLKDRPGPWAQAAQLHHQAREHRPDPNILVLANGEERSEYYCKSSGRVGDEIRIYGDHFTENREDWLVLFGDAEVECERTSGSQLICTAPNGTGTVRVQFPRYYYTNDAPREKVYFTYVG